MDLLNGNIKKVFFKYLFAAFGSTFTVSIYGMVDSMCIGRYHGPAGSASLSVEMPLWSTFCALGLLTGIGGSIMFSSLSGRNEKKKGNEYFTLAVYMTIFLSLIIGGALFFFTEEIMVLLGANDADVLYACMEYMVPLRYTFSIFMVNEMLAAFLRNDNDPLHTTCAVVCGGLFNVIGDVLFVFVFDMGARGAGYATMGSGFITFAILITHFFKKKNTLRLVRITAPAKKIIQIVRMGFAPCFLDLASGILITIFNVQVANLLGTASFAVLGVVTSVNSVALCCSYAVGQAAQPIVSMNYGAEKWDRIRETLKYAIISTSVIGGAFLTIVLVAPNMLVSLFMTPTEEVLEIAPAILRTYCSSYILMNINIFAAYYFQSIMQDKLSFIFSVARSIGISGALAMLLPMIFSPSSIWLAVPITDVIVFIAVVIMIRKVNADFGKESVLAKAN